MTLNGAQHRPLVLLVLHGPGGSRDAAIADETAAIARRLGAEVFAARIVPLGDRRMPLHLRPLGQLASYELGDRSDERLALVRAVGRDAGVDVDAGVVATADPVRAISSLASRAHPAAILVESPRRGMRARLAGERLARRLRRTTQTPVFPIA